MQTTVGRTLLGALLAGFALTAAAAAQTALSIEVVEGQGSAHRIDEPVAPQPVVIVRDAQGNPVPKAEVVFRSPTQGPSVTFFGAAHLIRAVTDEQGRAETGPVRPNLTPGEFAIAVEATFEGRSAAAEIRRVNLSVETGEKKRRRWGPRIWIPIAAAVTIVIVALVRD